MIPDQAKPEQSRAEQCLVCKCTSLEKLLLGYSRYNPNLFHHVAICKDCGHIQQHPLFNKIEYEVINDRFFGKQYMIGDQQNQANNSKKLRKLNERLSTYVQENFNILDVGAGEAWAMDFFQKKKCNYFAIEAVDRLALSIQERGGKVIGKTIYDDYVSYYARFDIIIFRHILEHLLNPKEALLTLKDMLIPEGLIYLALPNAAKPSIHKGFRTSFIRPVHISYFCEGNVLRLAHSVGLTPIHSKSSGEIYCLLREGVKNNNIQENYYTAQKEIFLTKAKQSFTKDANKIIKDFPRAIAHRLLGRE